MNKYIFETKQGHKWFVRKSFTSRRNLSKYLMKMYSNNINNKHSFKR